MGKLGPSLSSAPLLPRTTCLSQVPPVAPPLWISLACSAYGDAAWSSQHTFRLAPLYVCMYSNIHVQIQPSRADSSSQTTEPPVRPAPPLYPLPQALSTCSSPSALPFMGLQYKVLSLVLRPCSTQHAWPDPTTPSPCPPPPPSCASALGCCSTDSGMFCPQITAWPSFNLSLPEGLWPDCCLPPSVAYCEDSACSESLIFLTGQNCTKCRQAMYGLHPSYHQNPA